MARKAPKHGLQAQRDQIDGLLRKMSSGSLLNMDADELAVDRSAKVLTKRTTSRDRTKFLRCQVEQIGREIVHTVALFLKTMPAERAQGRPGTSGHQESKPTDKLDST